MTEHLGPNRSTTEDELEAILDRRNHRDLLLANALKDLFWKVTPYSSDDNESITSYIVPAGTLHRLAGHAQGFASDFRVSVAFRAAEVEKPSEPQLSCGHTGAGYSNASVDGMRVALCAGCTHGDGVGGRATARIIRDRAEKERS